MRIEVNVKWRDVVNSFCRLSPSKHRPPAPFHRQNKTNKAVIYANTFIFCSHYYRSKAIRRARQYCQYFRSIYRLRASSCGNLVVPQTRRRIGDRAFSVAAPRAWNSLPTELKLLRSTDLFRRDLKTFLFHSVYGHQDTDWLCDAPSVF